MLAESAISSMLDQVRRSLCHELSNEFMSEVTRQLEIRSFTRTSVNSSESLMQFSIKTGNQLQVNWPSIGHSVSEDNEIATMRIGYLNQSGTEMTDCVGIRAYWSNFPNSISKLNSSYSANGGIHKTEVESLPKSIKIGKQSRNGDGSWQSDEFSEMSYAVPAALNLLLS